MKSYIKFMALVAVSTVFVSCSKDDEPSGSVDTSKITPNSTITTDDGDQVLCTKVGIIEITYNSENFPVKIGDYRIRYDEGVITSRDEEYNFSMNSKGYITKLTASYTDEDGYDINGSISFSYDGSNHLTKVTSTYKEKGKESNYTCTEEGTTTISIAWSGDNVKSVKIAENETHSHSGGESFKEKYMYNLECYVNDSEKSYLRQPSYSFADMLDMDGLIDGMIYSGVLGKAPTNLPTDVTYEWEEDEDGDYDTGRSDYFYSYRFNSDGTIRYETQRWSNNGYSHDIYHSYTSASKGRGEFSTEYLSAVDSYKSGHTIKSMFKPAGRK